MAWPECISVMAPSSLFGHVSVQFAVILLLL